MEMKFKEYVVESKVLDDGSYEAVITTPAKDRQEEIVVSTGADIGAYMKNPVVLYGHDYAGLPVAKTLSLTTTEAGISARFIFPKAGVSTRADEVHNLWDQHFLNAISIGFIPKPMAPQLQTGLMPSMASRTSSRSGSCSSFPSFPCPPTRKHSD